MKKLARIALAFFVFGVFAAPASMLAAQHESVEVEVLEAASNSLATQVETIEADNGITEEERQVLLAEISRQLQEVEAELLRLSLLVTKLALQEQALALEQQLQQKLAQGEERGGTITMPIPDTPIPDTVVEESSAIAAEIDEPEEENAFSAVVLGQEEDEEQDQDKESGFLAALGPVGSLGTPELAALAILVFLLAFVFVRRMRRERLSRPVSSPQNVPRASQSVSQPQQNVLSNEREDLKEHVAWE